MNARTQRHPFGLSLAQRAIWMDMRVSGESSAYMLGRVFTFHGEVDPALARQALRVMMGRHEAMRLRVDPLEPRQWVESGGTTPFRLIDVSGDADPDIAAAAHFSAVRAEGLPLGEAPLLKIELVKLGASRWRMLFLCHHIMFDGVSFELAQRHWLTAYRTLAGDEADGGEAARSTYADVVEADAAYEQSARYREDISYWRQRLAGPPAPLFTGIAPTNRGEAPEPFRLDSAALARLEAASTAAGATLAQALVALFAIALARRTRRDDLIVGMALHRRDLATRHRIGCLAGLMPARARLRPDWTLARAVGALAQDFAADLAHARAPLDAIAREIGAAGGPVEAVVTIMPTLMETAPTFSGRAIEGERLRAEERTPISLYVNEDPGRSGLGFELGFRPDVVSPAEAGRVFDVFREILRVFGEREPRRVGDISGLSDREARDLAGWSNGPALPPPLADLASLFEAQADARPDLPAAVADEGALSYRELDAAAERVAARLVAEGVAPGAAVGVALPRSLESLVALLGILKAGAVYLPLDPDNPDARLAGMIEDAGAAVVLTLPSLAPRLPDVRRILLENGWPLSGETAARTSRPRDGADRAYIVFTSGSTGRPKGVAVSHGALVNLAYARRLHDPIGPGDRVLAAISIGFDVSLGQLLTPLLAGATVAVQGDLRGRPADAFWEFVARHGVTHVNSVPSFFASVLDAAPARTTLKRLMLGGEPLSGALATRLREQLGAPVFNMYGPTEACIDATFYEAPAQGAESVAVLPIGRPLPNYRAYVLDAALQLAPLGVEGELCLGGASLAEGYLNSPELTAERFVQTSFGRLYRTGDRAAWGEDGQLRFAGRADGQVKIRGHRVELGEIEAALLAAPGVAQAAAVARADARGETRVVGYFVGGADAEALRGHLRQRLPSHMIPSALMRLDALPLTLNGKLDAAALPEPEAPAPESLTPPQGATELWLTQAFAALFPATPIGRESHFFELGGHSLLATQLATKLRAARGVDLPLRALFDSPRLEDLARAVDALAPEASLPALTARPRPPHIPLSSAQERLWFLATLDPASAAYNIPVALKLDGRLDADALARALVRLSERHETLRTRFVAQAGLPAQEILAARAPDFAVFDLSDEAGLRAGVAREALRPFDLERDPLLRARLLRGPNDVLLLVVHHIIADGASMFVLLPELAALYGEETGAGTAALPALPVQFADYALWRRDAAFAARDEASLVYWRDALAGAPGALALPTDFARPERASGRGDSVPLSLGAGLSGAVRRFARARGLTPFIVLGGAWAALLARLSGDEDVVIGAPLANREAPGTEGLAAFLVNTVALRARFDDAPDFETLATRMRETVLGAHAHGDFPFERVVAALAPERSLARNPIFQAMFALQPAFPAALAFGAVAAEPIALMEKVAKFDLTLNLTESESGFDGALTYATDLFAPASAARMADLFARWLAAALTAPATPFDRLPLGADDGPALLAEAAGPTRVRVPASIPQLFAQRAAAQPQAPAAIFADATMSYAELDAATNRLAHALERMGARGRPVAVMLPRSEALVVAALGVMKAGAIYLPLDPAAPDARAEAMLDDASPAAFVGDLSTQARASGRPFLDIAGLGDESSAPLNLDIAPDAIAYLIYTSGSTGTPKGVAVSHAALATLANARLVHDPIGPGDRVLATMSVGFDVSLGQLVTPLLAGAAVVVAPPLAGVSGAEFWALMAGQEITHVNSGPAFLDAVLETPPPPDLALKWLMLGGEAFPTALARRIAAALPRVEIFNMYGPTEACIDATAYRFSGDETGATLPIGRALPNYRVGVRDPALNPLPPGVPGEIVIGGASLAQGYLNRPGETAARFVADPHAPGERLYRTGDRARVDGDGNIEFLGRIDAQVKIRGHRIEPEEIAAVLRRAPDVAQAVVVAAARGRETVLVAYAAPTPGAALSGAQLRARCETALPGYMVPSAFVIAASLPMTLNGKLDVKALPAPEFGEETKAPPTPPRDEMDAALIAIWRGLLESESLGIDDNFFRLGGHSLMAVRLVAAVETKLGIALPIAEIYRSQTIRALADAIRSGEATKTRGPLLKLGDGPGRPVFAIHPIGGGAFGYKGLAEALEGRRPVYGVQALGLEPGETPAETLDKMISPYLEAIQALQPHGPYALIGHSFGGLAALEIAHRLEQIGETVERLVLLDTSLTGEPWTRGMAVEITRGLLQREAERAGRAGEPIDAEQERRVVDIVANNMRLSQIYVPPRIRSPLSYVLARRGKLPPDGREKFWTSRSEAALPVTRVDCDHTQLRDRANVAQFAAFFV